MNPQSQQESTLLREAIAAFIRGRRDAKLEKLKPEEHEKRVELEAKYEPKVWIEDASRRVRQIKLASHILKALHPDARGTNVHDTTETVDTPGLVGTHTLGGERADDVVGNAAALDVYKFLCIHVGERSLLERVLTKDETLLAALSSDPEEARSWIAAFASIVGEDEAPSSHTLVSQVYFPLEEERYHLLAPLFPSSLVHAAQSRMREDRFGDAARAAREARRKEERFPHGYREYPELAIRRLGGTKPQNISQLNSERYGENWLLASLPPHWQSSALKPPLHAPSVFDRHFGLRHAVRALTGELRAFLHSVRADNNVHIRRKRAALVQAICDEAHQYAAWLGELPPGWSADARCELDEAEALWLDPGRAAMDEEFRSRRARGEWPKQVGHRFGLWLNQVIAPKSVVLSPVERDVWNQELSRELRMFRDDLEDAHD